MRNEKTGIYGIECGVTGALYVGSSMNIYTRWSQHRLLLRKGQHHSPYLQRAWHVHGEEAFRFFVLEECALDVLEDREQYYVDTRTPAFNAVTNIRSRTGVTQRARLAEVTRARAAAITHCPKGHEYTPTNTHLSRAGKRICRACNALRVAAHYQRESPEQREARRQTATAYAVTNVDQIEKRRLYAAAHREEKRLYDRQRQQITAAQRRQRHAALTPDERARYLAKKQQDYQRRTATS